jgi:hypothetical protein
MSSKQQEEEKLERNRAMEYDFFKPADDGYSTCGKAFNEEAEKSYREFVDKEKAKSGKRIITRGSAKRRLISGIGG